MKSNQHKKTILTTVSSIKSTLLATYVSIQVTLSTDKIIILIKKCFHTRQGAPVTKGVGSLCVKRMASTLRQ